MKKIFITLTFLLSLSSLLHAQDTLTTDSGLKYVYLKKGDGENAKEGSHVKLAYTAFKVNGKEFNVGKVKYEVGAEKIIPAWEEI